MASDFDVVIRGGSIMDGNGGEPFVGDVAVKDGKIAAIGKVSGTAQEEIDAPDCPSRPASWTFTPTTMARPCGTAIWRRRRGMA